MRKLPPLTALQAFEATARLGTVKKAAAELCVTPSAVSHQIARLESSLGAALFHRRNKRLIPTDAGRGYLQQVGAALDRLEEATWDLTEHGAVEELTVAAPPSFLTLWLLPLLADFRARHPSLNLRFLERLTLDEGAEAVDCGVEYRFGPPPDRFSEKLCDDEIVPLASPDLIAAHKIAAVEDLRGVPLISTERRLVSWRTALRDRDWLDDCPMVSVPFSYHAFTAALLGLGVALGNGLNAGFFIRTGQLAVPCSFAPDSIPPVPQYFFTCPEAGRNLPKVRAFHDWLKAAIAAGDQTSSKLPGRGVRPVPPQAGQRTN